MTDQRNERRRAPRAQTDFTISLTDRARPDSGTPTTRESRVQDLSSNGLRCTHPDPIDEMTLVQIGLQLPGDDRLHAVQGVVVRSAKLRGVNPPTYEIAIYFTELDADARKAVAAFVDRSMVADA